MCCDKITFINVTTCLPDVSRVIPIVILFFVLKWSSSCKMIRHTIHKLDNKHVYCTVSWEIQVGVMQYSMRMLTGSELQTCHFVLYRIFNQYYIKKHRDCAQHVYRHNTSKHIVSDYAPTCPSRPSLSSTPRPCLPCSGSQDRNTRPQLHHSFLLSFSFFLSFTSLPKNRRETTWEFGGKIKYEVF